MSRWKPDARARLEQAAYDLFRDRGYELTTVADIAERADLTERTFFRHFADKREVLFGGSTTIVELMLRAMEASPPTLGPLDVVHNALVPLARFMHGRRELLCERARIIAVHADLQERDLIKRARLTKAIADGLQRRGVADAVATLTAEIGIAVFYVSFNRWLAESGERDCEQLINDGFEELKLLGSGA